MLIISVHPLQQEQARCRESQIRVNFAVNNRYQTDTKTRKKFTSRVFVSPHKNVAKIYSGRRKNRAERVTSIQMTPF
jgi:hypothetical protein